MNKNVIYRDNKKVLNFPLNGPASRIARIYGGREFYVDVDLIIHVWHWRRVRLCFINSTQSRYDYNMDAWLVFYSVCNGYQFNFVMSSVILMSLYVMSIILFTMWDVVYNSNNRSQYRFEWLNFVIWQTRQYYTTIVYNR